MLDNFRSIHTGESVDEGVSESLILKKTAVRVTKQNLTESQKKIARENIGAADEKYYLDTAESIYEKMKGRFLPLTGGIIEGEDEEETKEKTIVTVGYPLQTILKGGSVVVKSISHRRPNLGTIYPPGTSILNIEDTVSISDKSIIGFQSETATSGWDKSYLKFQIDENGVQASSFRTKSQNIQGLLANNGSIATAISESDIDEMFNL